jgi:hypothetical protein
MEMWQLPVEHYLLRICEAEVSEKMKIRQDIFLMAIAVPRPNDIRNFGTHWSDAVYGFPETDDIQAWKNLITKLACQRLK